VRSRSSSWRSRAPPRARIPRADAFIAGYATAVLEREFGVTGASLAVKDGVIYLDAEDLGSSDRTRAEAALSENRGVARVEMREHGEAAGAAPPAVAAGAPQASDVRGELPMFLPRDPLFHSLVADPRWPHFSIA
jgi:hypothetical protein